MEKAGNDLIQTVEWIYGMPVSSGTFKGTNLIHCVADGDITAHFAQGDETRSFVAGDDFSMAHVDITVVSGSFDIQ